MAAAARPDRPPIAWWGTLLYPAALVALFLGCQVLAGLVGIGEGQRASMAAIPAVLAYNKINTDLARFAARLEGFATEFGAILSRQTEAAANDGGPRSPNQAAE